MSLDKKRRYVACEISEDENDILNMLTILKNETRNSLFKNVIDTHILDIHRDKYKLMKTVAFHLTSKYFDIFIKKEKENIIFINFEKWCKQCINNMKKAKMIEGHILLIIQYMQQYRKEMQNESI